MKGHLIVSLMLTLFVSSLIMLSLVEFCMAISKRLSTLSTIKPFYHELQLYRTKAMLSDFDIILSNSDLPKAFSLKNASRKFGFKPYFKTAYSNTIKENDRLNEISLSIDVSILNLKP